MLKSEIKPGVDYALREKRISGTPLQHVRIITHIRRNKWKAKWIDPNPGLVDYVESGQLIVPWKERKAFLKEEADAERLREYNERHGYTGDLPLTRALEEVFGSIGDDDIRFDRGVLSAPLGAIERLNARAGTDVGKESPAAYVDRQGILHLSFGDALEVGHRFCAAEPATVLVRIEATEREWSQKARHAGEEYIIGLLNEYRAAWALVRQWDGHDAAVAQREAEIQKLERLVWDAVYALQKARLDSEAARLRRAIEGR